jgi:hypothetical protein
MNLPQIEQLLDMIHDRLNYLVTSHEIDFQYIEKEVEFLTARVEELRFFIPHIPFPCYYFSCRKAGRVRSPPPNAQAPGAPVIPAEQNLPYQNGH